MKTRPLLVVLALVACTGSPLAREFTQAASGKSITGEVRAVNSRDGTVTIVLANGNPVTFKQSLLGDDDRAYLATWAKENAFANEIAITATKITGERGTKKDEIYQSRTQQAGYKISVRNRSTTEAIDGFTVHFSMVIEREGKSSTITGKHEVGKLAAGASAEITTEMVDLTTDMKSLSSCPTCVAHASGFKSDDITGILVKTERDGKPGKEEVFPGSRAKAIREAAGSKAAGN